MIIIKDSREFIDINDMIEQLNKKYENYAVFDTGAIAKHENISMKYVGEDIVHFYHILWWVTKRNGISIRVVEPTPSQAKKPTTREETLKEMYERICTIIYQRKEALKVLEKKQKPFYIPYK